MTDPLTPAGLSDTELEILRLVATGATNREIARLRSISEATVKKHLTNINVKLGTGNRTEAMRRALEMGLVSVETPTDRADGPGEERRARDLDVTRRLAEELERSRRRSRRLLRSLAAVAMILLLVLSALVYTMVDDSKANGASTPRATAVSSLTVQSPFWVPGARLPTARSGLAMVAVGGVVYAIGGQDDTGVLADTLRYEQGLVVQWQREPPKPTAVRDVGAIAVEGRIVVPGGCMADGRATDRVEIFDPGARLWSAGASLPKPVCGYGLAALDGRIYLFGGRRGEDPGAATDAVWTYRLGDAAWQAVEDVDRMPQPRADMGVAVIERDVHLLGGRDRSGQPWPDHWVFRPFDASKWDTSSGGALPEGRAGLVAVGIVRPDVGQAQHWIYVIGGGWDHNLQPGALLLRLGSDAGWQPSVDVGGLTSGVTPQRGAALAIRHAGGQLILAGGQSGDGKHLKFSQLFSVSQPGFLAPGE